jgi:hypothetical protein
MPSADDQPRVGEKVPRKNTNDKTRTSERGDAKQPRDGTIVGADLMAGARPPSPTSILPDDDQAATGSDSDGEADSGTYIFDRRARLVVDDLLARPEARGLSRNVMLLDVSRFLEAMQAYEPSSSRDNAADAFLKKAKELFSETGFGTMYVDPLQMLRLLRAAPTVNFDSWARSNNYGMVGSADNLEAQPASDSDSMARDLGHGRRTDCLTLQWHKCLNATAQGVTMTAGDLTSLLPQRVVDACPGHTTGLGEKERKKADGSLAAPDGLTSKIAALAPYTFGACLVKRGAEFFTRPGVLVVRACGAEVTRAAKTFFEGAGYRFLPLSDDVYEQCGLNANCARAVVGAKNPAPWGAYVAYKRGTMPLLVQCLPQAGACAAGPNARYWGGSTGIGLIYLTAANLERALAGKANIAFEDSLFCALGFSPEKAHARVAKITDGVVPWMTPCVLGGKISGERLREAWIAYNAGIATDAQKTRVKASEGWRQREAWIAYYAGIATDAQKTLVEASEGWRLREAWIAYNAGIATDAQKALVDANREVLANGRESMREARAAVDGGTASTAQKGSVQRENAGRANGRESMREAHAAVDGGTATGEQEDAVERQKAGGANGNATMCEARAAVNDGTATVEQEDSVEREKAGGAAGAAKALAARSAEGHRKCLAAIAARSAAFAACDGGNPTETQRAMVLRERWFRTLTEDEKKADKAARKREQKKAAREAKKKLSADEGTRATTFSGASNACASALEPSATNAAADAAPPDGALPFLALPASLASEPPAPAAALASDASLASEPLDAAAAATASARAAASAAAANRLSASALEPSATATSAAADAALPDGAPALLAPPAPNAWEAREAAAAPAAAALASDASLATEAIEAPARGGGDGFGARGGFGAPRASGHWQHVNG